MKISAQLFSIIILIILSVLMTSCLNSDSTKTGYIIGVNQFMQHPLLDDVYKGVIDGLNESAISERQGSSIIYKNASGDQNIAYQINKQFVDRKVDMIIPIATPSAQSACKTTKTIPIIFAAITDPVAAGIAETLERPGDNKTGTSDLWPYEKQIELIRKLLPKAKKVGIILNPGESNTEASMRYIRLALKKFEFVRVEVPVSSTSDVYNAAQSLIGRCDVLLAPADNTVVGAFAAVVKIADENRLPLFAGNIPCVENGAIATYGVNYYNIGKMTGKLAARVLKEKLDPGLIAVEIESKADLVINLKAARNQGVSVPEELIKSAARVFK